MNKAIFMGRLGRDPEIRVTQNGHTVAKFSLAVSRPKRQDKDEEVDWLNIVAWGKLAEIVEKYLKRGAKVLVTAAARTRNYEDKTGRKVYITEFVAESIEFCESRAKESASEHETNALAAQIDDAFLEYEGSAEDIPF